MLDRRFIHMNMLVTVASSTFSMLSIAVDCIWDVFLMTDRARRNGLPKASREFKDGGHVRRGDEDVSKRQFSAKNCQKVGDREE